MSNRYFRWQGLILPLLFLFVLSGCGPRHEEQPDCGFVQNVYGERISWKTSSPIPIYIHESFPDRMIPALERALLAWQETLERPMFRIVQTRYQSPGPRQDGVNVIYWLNSWENEKSTEQARTSIYWIGDQIREADIRLNDKDFNFFVDQAESAQDVHLESLLIHELGHVLGLKHKDGQGSVMATYLASQFVRNKVSQTDRDNLKCEY